VKRVERDLIGDESYFTGPQYGSGWEWEDLTWYYGAELAPSPLMTMPWMFFVKPGAEIGSPAVITTGPPDPLLTISNHVTTSARGGRRDSQYIADWEKTR